MSPLQEDWALQERLPSLVIVNNGKERYKHSFFCKMNPCIHSFRNLLGGLTQVQLFMLQILYRDSIRRGLRKEAKDALKLQMEFKQTLKLLATSPWS